MNKPMEQRSGGAAGRHRGVSGKLGPPNPNPNRRRLPCGVQGPMHNGGYHGVFKGARVEEAAARQVKRDARTHREQLAELDRRLGDNVGAKKERRKLTFAIYAAEMPDEYDLIHDSLHG